MREPEGQLGTFSLLVAQLARGGRSLGSSQGLKKSLSPVEAWDVPFSGGVVVSLDPVSQPACNPDRNKTLGWPHCMLKGVALPKCAAAGRAQMSLVLLFSRTLHERAVPKCPHSQGFTYPQNVRKNWFSWMEKASAWHTGHDIRPGESWLCF